MKTMTKAGNYYYEQLNKEQQKAYYAMKEGLLKLQDSFMVPMLSNKELSDIYALIRMDCPEIFYSVSFSYRYYADSTAVEMVPQYLFSKDKIKEHRQAMESRVKKLARQAENLDEKEKELYIHDFIVNNVKYDKLKKEYSHEIIGALGNGVAVCEGIAKAVKILCDEVGIWCIIALSEANPDKGIKYRHAWNVIRIDGQYYHLDVTFDNTLSKEDMVRYDYVNLSDKQIFRDHEPVIWKVPECSDNDHFYYREKKVSWTTMEEVQKRTKQAVKKGKVLLFHWRGGYLTREILSELLEIFDKEARVKDKRAYVSVNWPQAVLRVRFAEGVGEEQLEMPFNLAVLDINAADGIQERYPKIEKWYLGGHSLGGAMAASYLAEHSEEYDGLILLGSYSTADLSESGLDVLSVYGSEDEVMNRVKYNESKSNLPSDFTEVVIDGGCHAYFGMYGAQEGDGKPTISNEKQILLTAEHMVRLME